MNIGVVSDTHGQGEYTRQAVGILQSLDVDLVLHCGDIGAVEIVPLFDRWPAHFVLGNVDYDEAAYERAIRASGQTFHGRFGTVKAGGLTIALLHGDDERRMAEAIAGGRFDVVCHGHTHVAAQRQEGRTLVLNPGALYRARPHTFALLHAPSRRVESITV
jgi:putative phosphoesterase